MFSIKNTFYREHILSRTHSKDLLVQRLEMRLVLLGFDFAPFRQQVFDAVQLCLPRAHITSSSHDHHLLSCTHDCDNDMIAMLASTLLHLASKYADTDVIVIMCQ